MVDHPETYLLKKIVNHKENGLSTLGNLNAEHIKDIGVVMLDFANEYVIEAVRCVNEGKTIQIGDYTMQFVKGKKKN